MATLQLIILRHAKSDWYSGELNDFDRPLNQRGRRDAAKMGHWLAKNGYPPERVIASSATRAIETTTLFCRAAVIDESKVEWWEQLYHASHQSLISLVESLAEQHKDVRARVMIVGHNPGLEQLVYDLVADKSLVSDDKLMPTASIAIIDIDMENVQSGQGRLITIARPKSLLG
jgi:phosphohistidine phosphatase